MEASPEQLAEYEKQLADVDELIKASPEDESLLSLKSDLEELVAITKDTLTSGATESAPREATNDASAEIAADAPVDTASEVPGAGVGGGIPLDIQVHAATAAVSEPPKKKAKKSTDEFVIPKHLEIKPNDSEKELNRKKRNIKTLKRQHKAAQKEEASNQKQKSWLNFKKKKMKKKDGSIFTTHEDDSKVGVSTGRNITTFNDRTRHK